MIAFGGCEMSDLGIDRSKRPVSILGKLRKLRGSSWDVVVIGAGPAGSSAAIEIANTNRSVLLLDAKAFPRNKVCGGCLNKPASKILESLLGTQNPVWNAARKLTRFELHDQNRIVNLELPTGFSIERSILDEALVRKAVQSGATFVDGVSGKLERLHLFEEPAMRRVQIGSGKQVISVTAKCVVVAVGLGFVSKRNFNIVAEELSNECPLDHSSIIDGRFFKPRENSPAFL